MTEKNEDSEIASELLKEEGQTEVKEDENPPYSKKITREMIRTKPSDVESRPYVKREEREPEELAEYESKSSIESLESDIHEEEREKSKEISEQMEMSSQEPEAEKEDHLQKTLDGINKKIAEETTPEKKAALQKSADGLAKKISEGGKKVGTSIGQAYERVKEYQAKEPERIQSAIAVEKSKIQLAQERQKLEALRKQSSGGSGFGGSGLGSGGLPFSDANSGVGLGIGGKKEGQPQMIREKVTTFVRGKPVTTERWVPVKGSTGRREIPADRQDLYTRELQTARVYEEHLPFGGSQNIIGQEGQREAPFTGQHHIIGGQQNQQVPFSGNYGVPKRQPTRVIQRQQPAPFSGNYGAVQRQSTRVVRRNARPQQNNERQVVININQTPFGGVSSSSKKAVQVRRNVKSVQTKQVMPFGGFGLGKNNNKKGKWF